MLEGNTSVINRNTFCVFPSFMCSAVFHSEHLVTGRMSMCWWGRGFHTVFLLKPQQSSYCLVLLFPSFQQNTYKSSSGCLYSVFSVHNPLTPSSLLPGLRKDATPTGSALTCRTNGSSFSLPEFSAVLILLASSPPRNFRSAPWHSFLPLPRDPTFPTTLAG